MPLDPIAYQKVLQIDHHKQMRQMADPEADAIIRELVDMEGPAQGKKIFDLLISNIRLPKDQLPQSLLTFIDKQQQLPEWADKNKIRLAHQLFRDHGPKFLMFLYFKSLPTMYSCANGAQVLVQTGRLAHDDQSLGAFSRRIAETGQFLIDVMTEGGMEPGGVGIDSALRVRLVHSAIRSFIPQDHWEAEKLGQPINQADLATTLMTFSVAILDALDTIQVEERAERKDAYFHLWNIIGHLMGVHPDLIPPNTTEGRKYLQFSLQQESRSSEAGQMLSRALTSFVDEKLSLKVLEDLPEALIKMLAGAEIASHLGIENQGCLGMVWPAFLAKMFGWGEKLEDRFPQIRLLFDEMSFALSNKMVDYFNKQKNVQFNIPEYLQKDWGLHP